MSSRPKVTVLTPTYNRPSYLPQAIESVLGQRFQDWEMLVINDGGTDVRDVVEGFGDDRIRYLAQPHNRGKAACLNLGARQARGAYLAYLDDDDVWYPNHLEVLAGALDAHRDVGAAYSDLYRVLCIKDSDGRLHPLEKRVEVSRDYNRMFTFYFNHILHVSLMHRRSLLERAGGYNEDVRVLIDWNLTRKLSFYCGFLYVPAITGEYYAPVADSDRISDVERRDDASFRRNLRRIRSDLPPVPWPKVRRVVVVLPVSEWDQPVAQVVAYFADHLSYPCRIVLVSTATDQTADAPREALGELGELANLQIVRAPEGSDLESAYGFGIASTEADYYYLASPSLRRDADLRLVRAICFAEDVGAAAVRWPEEGDEPGPWDIMMTAEAAKRGCWRPESRGDLVTVTVPTGWLPRHLRMDYLLHMARECEADGAYATAQKALDRVAQLKAGSANGAYLVQAIARVAFAREDYGTAEAVCRDLIRRGYGPDNWVRLGQIEQRRDNHAAAVHAYERALEAIGLDEDAVRSDAFPLSCREDYDGFLAMVGLGECLVATGDFARAAAVLRKASRLRINSPRPNLAFGRLFLATGEPDRAEQALLMARTLAEGQQITEAEVALAEVYEEKGDLTAACSHAFAASAADPSAADAAMLAGRLALRAENTDAAERVYRQLLNHRPGHVPALLSLAHLCAALGRTAEATDLAERALVLRPGEPAGARLLDALRNGEPPTRAFGEPPTRAC